MSIAHRYDPGVPHALYLSNFGGAHGHYDYANAAALIEDITKALKVSKLLDKEGGYFLYGMTNGAQTKARGILKDAGFKATKIGNLMMHSITDKEFATAAALAIEAQAKEEARLKAEAEKAEKDRIERDLREGREPGELRVGDVVGYRGHGIDQRRNNPYIIVAVTGKNVRYVAQSQLLYYKMETLEKTGNVYPATDWVRADPDIEANLLKRCPNLAEFRKVKNA